MAPRPYWKGYLKLSLVTCPVTLMPAVSESEAVRFHSFNGATGNRVESRYVDAETGKPVADADQVRGFEHGEQDYVLIEDAEMDAVALESSRTLDIELFTPASTIEWIWYDRPHFLMPAEKIAEEAFSVIREAMRATGMVGISRLVLQRRERAVLLEPRGNGILLWTLRYGDEVRDEAGYFAGVPEKADADLERAAEAAIGKQAARWSPRLVEDPVRARLLEIIAAGRKKQGRKAKAPAAKSVKAAADNVIDLTEALKRSLKGAKRL